MVIEAAMTAAKEKREFFMMLPRLSWAGSWPAKFADPGTYPAKARRV
jgi:hypothetical protein